MHATLIDLQAFDLLEVSGDDSKKFLQGQVSCNTDLLTPDKSLSGAICNVKGRVIADFRLIENQGSCFLQLTEGMAGITKTVLDKYIVFSKAEATIVSGRFQRFGLIGNDAHSLLKEIIGDYPFDEGATIASQDWLVIKIPGLVPRYEIWQDLESPDKSELISELGKSSNSADLDAWVFEDINAGVVHITPAMSELYLPEALNFDIAGVIDFKKGCYTGQEIIARMYYRGAAKKRLYHVYREDCSLTLEGIESVSYQQNEQWVNGEIISQVVSDTGACHLLAILPVESVDENAEFCLNGQRDLTLKIKPLPYLGG